MNSIAFLILENGTIFEGKSIGVHGITVGEIVFNTAMTGYQEILTDPSYKNQIVTFTYPHIGNTGINSIDIESNKIQINGIIIKNLSYIDSNYQSKQTLSKYLKKNNIVAITDVDTRQLTRIIRDQGTQYGCIINNIYNNINYVLQYIKNIIKLFQHNLKKQKNKKKYSWLSQSKKCFNHKKNTLIVPKHIIVYDFGIKYNILRILINYNCKITVVPPYYAFKNLITLKPNGIILSNGPGDPRLYTQTIHIIKNILTNKIPMLGICLGHQLLALANQAKIIKMKFGHHGSNHPVQDLKTKKVFITAQNHNFTIDHNNLPNNMTITHKSLFDDTIQGIYIKNKNAWGFQGHPEGNPGPHDIQSLFNKFIQQIKHN